MDNRVAVSTVFREAWDLSRKRTATLVVVASFLLLVFTLADWLVPPDQVLRVNGFLGFFSFYAQLVCTAAIAGSGELPGFQFNPKSPTEGRYASAFGLSLIWVVSVVLGLILLIVPGLVLIARWSVSLPALIAEDLTITEALRRSWAVTRTTWFTSALICLVGLLLLAPYLVATLFYPAATQPSLGPALAANILFVLGLVTNWTLVASYFVLLARPNQRLA